MEYTAIWFYVAYDDWRQCRTLPMKQSRNELECLERKNPHILYMVSPEKPEPKEEYDNIAIQRWNDWNGYLK